MARFLAIDIIAKKRLLMPIRIDCQGGATLVNRMKRPANQ
jgi:hypothetical protein